MSEFRVESVMNDLLSNIDLAVIAAARVLDLEDVIEEDVEEVYDEIYHCGTCTVRSVMELVYPSIEAYMDYLETHKLEKDADGPITQ